jgi:signal transduction histidine kinase
MPQRLELLNYLRESAAHFVIDKPAVRDLEMYPRQEQWLAEARLIRELMEVMAANLEETRPDLGSPTWIWEAENELKTTTSHLKRMMTLTLDEADSQLQAFETALSELEKKPQLQVEDFRQFKEYRELAAPFQKAREILEVYLGLAGASLSYGVRKNLVLENFLTKLTAETPEEDQPLLSSATGLIVDMLNLAPLILLNRRVDEIKVWLGDFIHDLNSPLQVVTLSVDMVEMRHPKLPLEQARARIRASLRRINVLYNRLSQILSLVSLVEYSSPPTLQYLPLNNLVKECLESWQSANLKIEWIPDEVEPRAVIMVEALKEILAECQKAILATGQVREPIQAKLSSSWQAGPKPAEFGKTTTLGEVVSTLEIGVKVNLDKKGSDFQVQQDFISNFNTPLKTGLLSAAGIKIRVGVEPLVTNEQGVLTQARLKIKFMFAQIKAQALS